MVNNSSSPLTAKLILFSSLSLLIEILPTSSVSIVNLGSSSSIDPKCRLFVAYKEPLIITSPVLKSPSINGSSLMGIPSITPLLSIISLLLSFISSSPALYPISILPEPPTIAWPAPAPIATLILPSCNKLSVFRPRAVLLSP